MNVPCAEDVLCFHIFFIYYEKKFTGYQIGKRYRHSKNILSVAVFLSANNGISISCRYKQPANMDLILETLLISKFLISKDIRFLHPLNIYDISFTLEVSKLLTHNDVSFSHLWNMCSIFCTSDVSKLLKSIFVSSVQSLNIYAILVTFDVSKFRRSSFLSDEHPTNIPVNMFVLLVLNPLISMERNLVQFANIPFISSTFDVSHPLRSIVSKLQHILNTHEQLLSFVVLHCFTFI